MDETYFLYETHSHTSLCNHADGTTDDYAKVAAQKGLDGIIFTCHCPLPNGMSERVRMTPDEWPEYVRRVEATQEFMRDTLDVRLGVESDYVPGLEPWLETLHARNTLHYVLGSIHPQLEDYKGLYFKEDWPSFHRQYFSSLADAAEKGLFDCISHPDLIKNFGKEEYDLPALMDSILDALDRIAETGVAMELNTSGLNKSVPEMNPGPEILLEMNERGIPVVVGADVHTPSRVAADYPMAFDLLEQAGYSELTYFLDRSTRTIPITVARAKLTDV